VRSVRFRFKPAETGSKIALHNEREAKQLYIIRYAREGSSGNRANEKVKKSRGVREQNSQTLNLEEKRLTFLRIKFCAN
jgi:hypothetical protein